MCCSLLTYIIHFNCLLLKFSVLQPHGGILVITVPFIDYEVASLNI